MMKTLVVYYSYDGNTRLMAEAIAKATGGDVQELRPKDEKKRTGFMKYLWGGHAVVSKKKPELEAMEKDPGGYDLIFVGTPVWAGTYAPALRSLFTAGKVKGKKVALFCCYGGSAGKALVNMRAALAGNEVVGETGFRDPAKRDPQGNAEKAQKWARGIAGV